MHIILLGILHILSLQAAIVPPPWADTNLNPCATQPGGWLFLFWPPDGKCYKIFQRGPPCPETMELGPIQDPESKRMIAECRCPPGTAQSARDARCHPIFKQGPCNKGHYFTPVEDTSKRRWGKCIETDVCRNSNEVFWATDGKCYQKYTKGPCPLGQLITFNPVTKLSECACDSAPPMSKYYWSIGKACYQLYTRGPCLEKGTLYLPGPKCGCQPNLPNYYQETGMCYELGGVGPCPPGHRFEMDPTTKRGVCTCKPEHIKWADGHCYRLYTRGPCQSGQLLQHNNTCIDIPCRRGRLYFPQHDSCHRVGVQGPCDEGQLVLFEQSVRPSIEGISYKGVCGCSGPEAESKCSPLSKQQQILLNTTKGHEARDLGANQSEITQTVISNICENTSTPNTTCHQLYTQGPCHDGEWLVPNRRSRGRRQTIPKSVDAYLSGHRFKKNKKTNRGREDNDLSNHSSESIPRLYQDSVKKTSGVKAHCECRSGFVRPSQGDVLGCRPPLIELATFLNGRDLFNN